MRLDFPHQRISLFSKILKELQEQKQEQKIDNSVIAIRKPECIVETLLEDAYDEGDSV